MRRALAILASLVATAVLLPGCATHFENKPLSPDQTNPERRVVDLSQPERPLILLAISGGGSRAAALGWVVLRELQRYSYADASGTRRALVDDIAVISSVSGGSVIAAQFALNGAAGLDRFEADFLAPDNTRTLLLGAVNPVNWFSLGFAGGSRSTLVEQLFDRELYGHKTFAELNRPGKPYLIMNATDMVSGEVFAFTPQRFDDICSDLDAQAISTGVVASAAVPLLFAPIALQNHSAVHCAGRPAPQWISKRLKGEYARYLNPDEFKLARYANDLRHGPDTFRQIDYLYFLDGGLADNLAVHGLLEAMSSPYAAPIVKAQGAATEPSGTLLEAINNGRAKKIVVIVINARADPASKLNQSDSRPGIFGMIGSVVSVPINSASSSINGQMDALVSQFNASGGGTGAATPSAPLFVDLKTYGIEIDFDQLRADDPVQRALRDEAKEIPTLWTISKPNLDVIEAAGVTLLRQHPCFQRLLSDLSIDAAFVKLEFARMGCRQTSDP